MRFLFLGVESLLFILEGAKVEFGEVSYTVDEGDGTVGLEVVRYSDSSSELVVTLTLRDGTARGKVMLKVHTKLQLMIP